MQKTIKSFTVLEDGYIVIQLAKKSDVDTYMASLIQKNKGLLPCMQDQKVKSKFYYDRRKFASLTEIFESYFFMKHEALVFLEQLFQQLKEVEEEFPIVLELDCIYVQRDLRTIACIALPIHEHVNSENNYHLFLREISDVLHAQDEVEMLGRLALCMRISSLSSSTMLEELRKKRKPLVELLKWRELKQKNKDLKMQNELAIEELFASIQRSYEIYKAPVEVKKEEPVVKNETVELFARKQVFCSLKDAHGFVYELDKSKRIGRGEDCDIVLSGQTISTHHAQLHVDKNRVYLEDVCSSNGTRINEETLLGNQRYLLHDQDRIHFADTEMTFYKEG